MNISDPFGEVKENNEYSNSKYTNNVNINLKNPNVLVIPGYYYDESSKRYFLDKNSHNKEFSQYLEEKNERITKKTENNNFNYEKKKQITKSLFDVLKNKKLGDLKLTKKKEIAKILNKHEIEQYGIIKLMTKSLNCQYELFINCECRYLIWLDNKCITIQKIMTNYNNEAKIYKIFFNFQKYLTKFKILNDILFLFCEFKVYTLNIKEIIENYEKGLFTFKIIFHYQNFTNFLSKVSIFPATYNWPVIKEYKSKTSYLFLFCKKIFSVNFNLISKENIKLNINSKEVYLKHCFVDLDQIIKDKNYNLIEIETEKYFENYVFTDFNYNPHTNFFYFGESMGNIHIYDSSFKIKNIINNRSDIPYSILNFLPVGREMITIGSNSNIEYINYSNNIYTKMMVYQSSLQSHFKVNKHVFLHNQVKLF